MTPDALVTPDGTFEQFTGHRPYLWQQRLIETGLPETLEIPTGCGKTEAVFTAWAYRRRLHPDSDVRAGIPRRLVWVLPQRSLVEQTVSRIRRWVSNAGWGTPDTDGHLPVHVLMGGEPVGQWQMAPDRDMVIVGTLDMILSRALNRGYATSRYAWTVDFGLLNNDCQYVYDEVQLMDAAAVTSRQLDGLRADMGTAVRCRSTWMSATLDAGRLSTVDNPDVDVPFSLAADEIGDRLSARLGAERTVGRWVAGGRPPKRELSKVRAARIAAEHRPGTLTIAVVNQVETARTIHDALRRELDENVALVLLHSRYRPGDRSEQMRRVLDTPGDGGTVVVSTQVVEAGVDLDAATMFTETAPWSSIVQRSGRCNRTGTVEDARLFWDAPDSAAPYPDVDVETAEAALDDLENMTVTTSAIDGLDIPETGGEPPLALRRRDLIGLFDTTSDLTGNDIDITGFLRTGDDSNVSVCWRDLNDLAQGTPCRDEICQVPVGEVAAWVKDRRDGTGPVALRLDFMGTRSKAWVDLNSDRVRPGMVLILDVNRGGYTAETGWDRKSPERVPSPPKNIQPVGMVPLDERETDEPSTFTGNWMTLETHLADAGNDTKALLDSTTPDGITSTHVAAAVRAARLHDLGKAHPVFQDTLRRSAGVNPIPFEGPWAKSGHTGGARHSRRHFRHELVSALALIGGANTLIADSPDPDLIVYLVVAHHGKVRMTIRGIPGETAPAGADPATRVALGVVDGDPFPATLVDGETVGPFPLSLDPMSAGTADGPSWAERTSRLVARPDLGPFRLGYLEAIVRIADWRVSKLTEGPR